MIQTSLSHRLQVHSYINTCGVSDPIARKQLFDFSDGIYDLGLWNSMVCWPMRSTQNVGIGTNVVGLGGLASNATMAGNYTWTPTGMNMTYSGTPATMATSVVLGIAPVSVVSIHRQVADFGMNVFLFLSAGVNVSGRQICDFNTLNYGQPYGSFFYGAWPPSHATHYTGFLQLFADTTKYRYASWRFPNSSQWQCSYDGNQSPLSAQATWDSSSPAFTRFGIYDIASQNPGYTMQFGFYSAFTVGLSDTQDTTIRQLYKSTLGQGLGLP